LRHALWRRLVLPGITRIFDVYRSAGLPVFFHTCGRADDLLPDLLEAGATVFNLESCAADLPALRARFARRIVFYGGVPVAVMAQGKAEDVRQAALTAMYQLGREGGLILAPDQPLAFSAENERTLAETAQQLGYYPLMPAV
jgi:uroporphyrinogen decarboxylase